MTPGWLAQVTPISVHGSASCQTASWRPDVDELASSRNSAETNRHPDGTPTGSSKRTNVRKLSPRRCDLTFSVVSSPLLFPGLFCSIHASAVARLTIDVIAHRAGAVVVVVGGTVDVVGGG